MKFFVMVGLPGSGKSTKANELAKEYNAEIFSSDKIGKELYGTNDIPNGPEVFEILNERLEKALKENKNVIMDATNLRYNAKKNNIDMARKYNAECIAIFMDTPLEECLRRNVSRERVVPKEVILRMHSYMSEPTLEEGFDKICTY